MIIRYVREGNKPIGCVIGLSVDRIGWSLCCKKDIFSKKMARLIALGRATNGFNAEIPRKIWNIYEEVENRLIQQS